MSKSREHPNCGNCIHGRVKDDSRPKSITCELDPPVAVQTGVTNHIHGGRSEYIIRWLQPEVSPEHNCSKHQEKTEE